MSLTDSAPGRVCQVVEPTVISLLLRVAVALFCNTNINYHYNVSDITGIMIKVINL